MPASRGLPGAPFLRTPSACSRSSPLRSSHATLPPARQPAHRRESCSPASSCAASQPDQDGRSPCSWTCSTGVAFASVAAEPPTRNLAGRLRPGLGCRSPAHPETQAPLLQPACANSAIQAGLTVLRLDQHRSVPRSRKCAMSPGPCLARSGVIGEHRDNDVGTLRGLGGSVCNAALLATRASALAAVRL